MPSTHTLDKQACLPRLDPVPCHSSLLPVYSVCVYSRGSGSELQPLPCAAGGLGCVLGWPVDSLSYGRHSHCAQVHLFAFPPSLVRAELGC
jgi:hypothetical protein